MGAALRAQALGILIPAYFDPGPTGTNWDSLAAAAGRVPVAVIMNPNNGPSTSARSSYTKAIAKVRGAGGQVIG